MPIIQISKKLPVLFFLFSFLFLSSSHAETAQPTPKLKDVIGEENLDTENSSNTNGEIKKLIKLGPDDEFNRGIPRSSVSGYFKAVKAADYKRAAQYLDLRNLPKGYSKADGAELARQLKIVLDRTLWVEMDLLSTQEQGHSDDGLPTYRDLVGQIEVDQKKYDILLQHVPRKDGVYIWKFSSKTISHIPVLYNSLGYGPVGEQLSKHLPEFEFLGLELWQWVFLLLIILTISIVSFPIFRIISWLISLKKTPFSLMAAKIIRGPAYAVFIVIMTRHNFDLIHPSLTARAISEGSTLLIIVVTWLIIRSVSLFREFYIQRLKARNREHAIVLLNPALTTLKILIIFIGILIWLDNIGFSVTTVLAGLGIGGIAIALATQKSIENFIGALTLYLAAPVKVGDFCKFGDKTGIVEEIGLRATKLRTLEDTIIIIPNADFAAMQIENMAERKRFRFNPLIKLHFETTADQLRFILLNIQKLLYAHSKVADAPLRANFTNFGADSLDIEVNCYIDTNIINEYKSVIEDLNLRIMDIIKMSGTQIAIPASIEYSGNLDKTTDNSKLQPRQEGDSFLINKNQQIVKLTQQQIDEIKNTIIFPAD